MADEQPRQPGPRRENGKRPPGDFVSEELEDATARFIEEVKERAKRRTRPSVGPPPKKKGR